MSGLNLSYIKANKHLSPKTLCCHLAQSSLCATQLFPCSTELRAWEKLESSSERNKNTSLRCRQEDLGETLQVGFGT